MENSRTLYREYTPWNGVVYAILWGAVLLACYPILAGWDGDVSPALRFPLVGGIVVVVAVVTRLLGGLTVLIQSDRILVHLGRTPVIRRSVPFDEIVSIRSVQYRPIVEFGGWGVRGLGKRKAWSARGSQAVALQLTGDRELLIGTDHPSRLEERIRTVARIPAHE